MASVPVIDLARLGHDPAERAALDAACRAWGVFELVGHGVPDAEIDDTLARIRAFFALPVEHKRALARTATNPWGFTDRELTKRRRDRKEIFDVGPPDASGPFAGAAPRWPSGLPGFESAMWRWYRTCEALSRRLVAALATTLGAAPDALADAFEPTHTSFLRLNHYPVSDEPADLGVHHHTDAGAVTILLHDDYAGLELRHGGVWRLVEPAHSRLVVNLGDVVQVWSNDRYPAPVHRVRASRETARTSAPFFFNPSYDADYAPLSEPPRYRPINWGHFRAGRAAGDYADLGEEIQISDFRI